MKGLISQRNILVWIVFLLSSSLMMAQKRGVQCRWHDAAMHNPALSDYHEKENILYLLSNNQEYLYINLVIPRDIEQRKILLFGNTLWFDLQGKTKKKTGVTYPVRNPAAGTARQGANRRGVFMEFDVVKYDLVERARLMALHHYSDTAARIIIPSSNPMEVHGWMTFDQADQLHYTVVVPFNKIPIDSMAGENGFSIGLETGYFDPEQMQPGSGNRPPGNSAGRQGNPANRQGNPGSNQGRPGGPGGGGRLSPEQRAAMMEIREALSYPTKFRIRNIRLAEQ